MRAYFHDDLPGDERLPHDTGRSVSTELLKSLGVLHWSVPVDDKGEWEEEIDTIAKDRDYKNRDIIEMSRELLGDSYEEKLQKFLFEHIHEDEEIRYCLGGSGFFDVRDHSTESWIRIHVVKGDLMVLPAGIYHRFTLDTNDKMRTMRLFKDVPKWIAHNRSAETDANPHRVEYLKHFPSSRTTEAV
ncbi:Acireductone dioxygenase [Abortiporus biennis]|nr:Acireductone dioxygenase [Abortiporus biennis]